MAASWWSRMSPKTSVMFWERIFILQESQALAEQGPHQQQVDRWMKADLSQILVSRSRNIDCKEWFWGAMLPGEAEKGCKENGEESNQEIVSATSWSQGGTFVCYLHPRIGPTLSHLLGSHCLWVTPTCLLAPRKWESPPGWGNLVSRGQCLGEGEVMSCWQSAFLTAVVLAYRLGRVTQWALRGYDNYVAAILVLDVLSGFSRQCQQPAEARLPIWGPALHHGNISRHEWRWHVNAQRWVGDDLLLPVYDTKIPTAE